MAKKSKIMNIFISKGSQQYGPYSLDVVKGYISDGTFTHEDFACFDGQNWVPLSQVPGVSAVHSAVKSTSPKATGKSRKGLLIGLIGGVSALVVASIVLVMLLKDNPKENEIDQRGNLADQEKPPDPDEVTEVAPIDAPKESFRSENLDDDETVRRLSREALDVTPPNGFQWRGDKDNELNYAPGQVEPFNGWAKIVRENGQLKKLALFKEGLMEEEVQFYADGQKGARASFKDRYYHGKVTFWYENGNVYKDFNYLEGDLHGDFKIWMPNGHLETSGKYDRGKKTGTWSYFNRWNSDTVVVPYLDDEPTGKNEKEKELNVQRAKMEEQARLAEDMYFAALDDIDAKEYEKADMALFKIKNYLEPNTRTWPIILEASLVKNEINLEKAKDAIAYKDLDLAAQYIDAYRTGFFQDRDIQGDTLSYGRAGLKATKGQDSVDRALDLANKLEDKLKAMGYSVSTPNDNVRASDSKLERKLKIIQIPGVQFFESPLDEAMQELQRQARAFDLTEPDPAKKGVNIIVLSEESVPVPNVTVTFNAMPLGQMIKFATEMIGWNYDVRADAVVISKSGAPR